jgi:hypothetical protein
MMTNSLALAVAALLNVLQSVLEHNPLAYFQYLFAKVLELNIESFEDGLKQLQEYLHDLVVGGQELDKEKLTNTVNQEETNMPQLRENRCHPFHLHRLL